MIFSEFILQCEMNLHYNHYRQDRNLGITFRGGIQAMKLDK